jgi:hypothetical protein
MGYALIVDTSQPAEDRGISLILGILTIRNTRINLITGQPVRRKERSLNMTDEDNKALARRYAHSIGPCDFGSTEAIKVFAEALRQVRADEREANANLSEEFGRTSCHPPVGIVGKYIAKAIRERGK